MEHRSLPEILESLSHTLPFESAIIADYMTEKILRRMEAKLFVRSLDQKLPTYTAVTCMAVIREIVKAQEIARDEGEPPHEKPELSGHPWEPSAEPVSSDRKKANVDAERDRWVRKGQHGGTGEFPHLPDGGRACQQR